VSRILWIKEYGLETEGKQHAELWPAAERPHGSRGRDHADPPSANSLASLLAVVQRHAEDQVVVLAAQTDAFIATSARLSSTASRATVSIVGAPEKETRAQVKRARAGFGRPSPCTDLPCASSRPASAILDGRPVPPPQYIDAFAFAGGGPRLAGAATEEERTGKK
jgi:hypothetical protein